LQEQQGQMKKEMEGGRNQEEKRTPNVIRRIEPRSTTNPKLWLRLELWTIRVTSLNPSIINEKELIVLADRHYKKVQILLAESLVHGRYRL
jgi:hypothetical protein